MRLDPPTPGTSDTPTVLRWRKSRRSQAQNGCVEVAFGPGRIGVRDSKQGASGPLLAFDARAWTAFTARARAGWFDR
ncbi:DUF397 domain-containing protein [Parasphingorhabdus pacifica]